MTNISDQKQELRSQMRQQRAALETTFKGNYDQWICQSIWELIEAKGYQTIHCYLPMGHEIDIIPLIEKMLDAAKTVITPKTLPKRNLQHLRLNALAELEDGVFGTRHPAHAQEFSDSYDLIIVPGLAFDAANYRLGYGGGYYDGFLLQHPTAYKLGICYPFQRVKNVPVEAHDIQLNAVLVREDLLTTED